MLNLPLINIKPNEIILSKYSLITFLPLSLLYQFNRPANVYFLIIAIIQSIPLISPLASYTAIGPLAFVLSVSMIREGWEDYQRHVYDNQLNSEPVNVFRNDKWEKSTSGKLLIGEIVFVEKNDPFPADLILLDSNLEDGVCFIETATLDGEKTLKNKIANKKTVGILKNTKNLMESNFAHISGTCTCDLPNSELYVFDGTIELEIKKKKSEKVNLSLDAKQLLLKGKIHFL